MIKVMTDTIKSVDQKFIRENRPLSTRKAYTGSSWMMNLESDYMKLAERWLQTNFSCKYSVWHVLNSMSWGYIAQPRHSIRLRKKNSNKEPQDDKMTSEVLQTSRSQKHVNVNSTNFNNIRWQNSHFETEYHESIVYAII